MPENEDHVKLLIVEDNPVDEMLLRARLEESDSSIFRTHSENRIEAAIEWLKGNDADVILLDLNLPDSQGLQTLYSILPHTGDRPILVLSGLEDDDLAIKAIRKGAQDYIHKRHLSGKTIAGELRKAIERQNLVRSLTNDEARISEIIRENSDGIVVVDQQGLIVFANPAAEILFGRSSGELEGKNFGFPIVGSEKTELQIMHSQGDPVDVELQVAHLYWDKKPALLVSLRDVTSRKQRERELEAVVVISAGMRKAQVRDELLTIALENMFGLLDAEGMAIGLVEPRTNDVIVEIGVGIWKEITGFRIPSGQGMVGMVIQTGLVHESVDVKNDPRIYSREIIGDSQTMICVPLSSQNRNIGAVWAGRQTPFIMSEKSLLTAVADMAASAIERQTLHEKTEQRLQRLAALRVVDIAISTNLTLEHTLDVLLGQVVAHLDVNAASVLLLDHSEPVLKIVAVRGFRSLISRDVTIPTKNTPPGRAITDRQIVAIPNIAKAGVPFYRQDLLETEGINAYFCVPLITKETVRGVLEVFQHTAKEPDPEWLEFFETLGGQAAIAIDNSQLFEDLQVSNHNLRLAYDATIEGWARALDLRDNETEGHARRVTALTVQLAKKLGITDEVELENLRRGALLHDIGKMAIPDHILLKPGPLDENEWKVMKLHPLHAFNMLEPFEYLRPALDIPFCHHEKWDGTGYPRGLEGDEIPFPARVFSVVDVWDALSSDRPYRKAWSEEKVLAHIQSQSGTHFDPQIVGTFLELVH